MPQLGKFDEFDEIDRVLMPEWWKYDLILVFN